MKTLEDNGYRNVAGLKRQFAIELDKIYTEEFWRTHVHYKY